MSDGEDDELDIIKGDTRETFRKSEANDAKKVQARFFLDHEPACVFQGKKKRRNRVNFW